MISAPHRAASLHDQLARADERLLVGEGDALVARGWPRASAAGRSCRTRQSRRCRRVGSVAAARADPPSRMPPRIVRIRKTALLMPLRRLRPSKRPIPAGYLRHCASIRSTFRGSLLSAATRRSADRPPRRASAARWSRWSLKSRWPFVTARPPSTSPPRRRPAR